jgi:hypothetical protein
MFSYEQFHDGAFEGLLIEGKTVHVFVSTDRNEQFVLIARAVAALTADGILAGNIILDIETRATEELTLEDIRDAFEYDRPEDDAYAKNALSKAQQSKLSLLAISPSYGGSCLILAESINLIAREEWMLECSAVHRSTHVKGL